MKKILTILFTLSLAFSIGCVQNRTSALEELRKKYSKDPIESLRFPEKNQTRSTLGSKTKADLKKYSVPSNSDRPLSEDLKSLRSRKKLTKIKKVLVTAKETTLRKGPGTEFQKAGTASKGDMFNFLKVMKGPRKDQNWYLVHDDKESKFFISALFSTLHKDAKDKLSYQQKLNKRKDKTLKKLQTIFDPSPPLPKELAQAKHITLNFEETDLYDVITTFCELLKLDYIIEGAISGKVTLQTFNKISVDELYSVLEQILALNNITVVKSGNFYRFLPIKDAVKKPLSIYYGSDANVPPNERLVIQIIPLKHISGESMKKIITPLLTPNASFLEIPETNNLMLVELGSNVNRILKVVEALDIDKLSASDIELFTMQHTQASLVATELDEVFRALGFEDALGTSLNFLPLTRLNSILVVNPFKSILPAIEFWIKKLDQPILESQVATYVYYVQNGEAGSLASILTEIFKPKESTTNKSALSKKLSGKKPGTKSKKASQRAPGSKSAQLKKSTKPTIQIEGELTAELDEEFIVIPDKDTNSLIMRTHPRTYPAVLELLKKLDLMPQQVLIEVLIMDLVLDKSTQAGMEWALEGKLDNANFSTGSGTGSGLGSTLGSVTPLFADPGFSFFLGNANKIKALLQALSSDSKAKVLSNPTLVTSDNKSANISITNEIPIQSTTITTPTAGQPLTQSTIQFKSVGIKLGISPKINSDNFVNLQINQEISTSGAIAPGTNTPSFNVRSINTEVVLKDNQVLVMGGLMQTDETEATTGIPGLKDIPIFGQLFRSNNQTKTKSELMVFVTPHVISHQEDANLVTSRLKNRLHEIKRDFKLNTNRSKKGPPY